MTDDDLSQIELTVAAGHYPYLRRDVLSLVVEVRRLRSIVKGLVERVVDQSEILSRMAEKENRRV